VTSPVVALARWLDQHDGVVTGLATVAIAALTLQLATYARHQEEILRHQIADTEDIQRAFVFIDDYETVLNGNTLSVRPKWKNSGTTPTGVMTTWISYLSFPGKVPDTFQFPDIADGVGAVFDADAKSVKLFLGPQGSAFGHRLPIDYSFVPLIDQGKMQILIWGWAKYTDVFRKPHITRFASLMHVERRIPPPNTPASVPPVWNISYDHYGRNNCTDEECSQQGIP
jgi:hypothetical protein